MKLRWSEFGCFKITGEYEERSSITMPETNEKGSEEIVDLWAAKFQFKLWKKKNDPTHFIFPAFSSVLLLNELLSVVVARRLLPFFGLSVDPLRYLNLESWPTQLQTCPLWRKWETYIVQGSSRYQIWLAVHTSLSSFPLVAIIICKWIWWDLLRH